MTPCDCGLPIIDGDCTNECKAKSEELESLRDAYTALSSKFSEAVELLWEMDKEIDPHGAERDYVTMPFAMYDKLIEFLDRINNANNP